MVMGVVNFTVVNGEILAENRDNVRRWSVPDPLGSTVALLDNIQTNTCTFTFWPYGESWKGLHGHKFGLLRWKSIGKAVGAEKQC